MSDLYPQQKKRNPFSLTFFSVFPPSSLLDVQRLFSWQWLSRSLQQAGRHLRIFLNTLITHTAIVSIRRPHSFFPSFLMELPLRVVSDFPVPKVAQPDLIHTRRLFFFCLSLLLALHWKAEDQLIVCLLPNNKWMWSLWALAATSLLKSSNGPSWSPCCPFAAAHASLLDWWSP